MDRREPLLAVPRSPRYKSLDIWRGLACLLVVVFHSSFYSVNTQGADSGFAAIVLACMSKLWIGVPVFFVISGYCISATADSSRRRSGSLGDYFIRRFRRIFPPFWVFLLASIAIAYVVEGKLAPGLFADSIHPIPRPWELLPLQWAGNLSLTESWRAHVAGPGPAFFMGHAWTLCYEEQFYAVTGLLLLISRSRFFLLALVVSVLTFGLVIVSPRMGLNLQGFFVDGRWLLFAAGVLLYYCINYGGTAHRRAAYLCFAAGIVWALTGCASKQLSQEAPIAAGFALLVLAIHPFDKRLAEMRTLWPLQMCGKMCYSLYLVHWPVVKAVSHLMFNWGLNQPWQTVLITVPVCISIAIPVAWVFHCLVERRFLNAPQTSRSLVVQPPTGAPVFRDCFTGRP